MVDDFLKHTVTLTVGDWSRDGHNQFDVVRIQSNRTMPELLDAWSRGMTKLGLKHDGRWPYLPWCENYQDSVLPNEAVKLLTEAGVDITQFTQPSYKDESVLYLEDSECYAMLWLAVAWLADDKLVYKIAPKYENNLNIGGYGLFHQ